MSYTRCPPEAAAAAVGGAQINTGTYTGDGTISQGITGIGFAPKFVWVAHNTAGVGGRNSCMMMDQMPLNSAHSTWNIRSADMIISLDADGFTVDDGGTDADPNKNTRSYWYLALG